MEPLQPHQSRWYRRTDPQGRALLALLLPLAGVYLCQLVTLQEPAAAWAWMGSHAGAAGDTYLVLLLAQLLVTTLTDSLLCGQLLTLLPCLLLSVASHLKQAVNGVPLLVSDLAMAGQAGQVAGFLRPGMELGEGTWGGIALAALLFLAAFVWSRPARPLDGRRRLGVLGLLAALLAWVLLSPASAVLLAGEEGESQSMRNDRLGLLAGLYSAARESAMAEPDSYSEDGMNRILLQLRAEAEQSAEPAVKPNVVLVVSESFFDPTCRACPFPPTRCPTSTPWRRRSPAASSCPTPTPGVPATWRWNCSPASLPPSWGRGSPSPAWAIRRPTAVCLRWPGYSGRRGMRPSLSTPTTTSSMTGHAISPPWALTRSFIRTTSLWTRLMPGAMSPTTPWPTS